MEAHRLCDRLIYALTCMPPKLVAIVELSLSFLSEGALIDALMFVKGSYDIFWSHFWGRERDGVRSSLLGCGQDREGPLG